MAYNWTCPYCDRAQVITDTNEGSVSGYFPTGDHQKRLGITAIAVLCANTECKQTTVEVEVRPWVYSNGIPSPNRSSKTVFSRRVLPEGTCKPVPAYVPRAIREDYREACLIRDLSPKAAATLARRCLQGMIRDFAKISVKGKRLVDEIKALEKAVEDDTAPRGVSVDSIEALTAVRKVGNIGAHMEADIDLIVDVDPGEAQVLIELIESLIDDWYVEAHKRSARFASAVALAADKDGQLSTAKADQLAIAAPDLGAGADPIEGPETRTP